MADETLLDWKKLHNVSAVILRPDMHVYGCADSNDTLSKVDKLAKKLHNKIYAKTN
jgi:hypothetical protein